MSEAQAIRAYFGVDSFDTGTPDVDVIEGQLRIRPTGPVGAYISMPIKHWDVLASAVQTALNDYKQEWPGA